MLLIALIAVIIAKFSITAMFLQNHSSIPVVDKERSAYVRLLWEMTPANGVFDSSSTIPTITSPLHTVSAYVELSRGSP
jgi:hypothetical protein